MTVIKKLKVSPEAQWWIDIRPMVDIFAERIQESPMLRFEHAPEVAKELNAIYTNIQQITCPDSADELYTYLTRSILNLFMCYQSVADFQWDRGEIFYGRAVAEWTQAKGALNTAGIRKASV